MSGNWTSTQSEAPWTVDADDRKVALLRFVLAIALLVAEVFVPSNLSRWSYVAYSALGANVLYSAAVYIIARRKQNFPNTIVFALLWIDTAGYSLFASFFHPMYLLALGLILSYWTAAESRSKKRLALLKELSVTANPRLGVDRTAGLFMSRVLKFFGADVCVFAQFDPQTEQYQIREATRFRLQGGVQIAPPSGLEQILPTLPPNAVALYHDAGRWHRSSYRIVDPMKRGALERPSEDAASIAAWLRARSLMAVPLRRHEIFRGYLCLGAARSGAFKPENALFLLQVAAQIMPVLEHIRLLDHMASDAADEERRRIARSIHDRIIQPYLGLQIGLRSVHQMIRSEVEGGVPSPDKWRRTVSALESLIAMTRDGVAELRQYMNGLRQSTGGKGVLVDAISRYASKFETATDVHVNVIDRMGDLEIQDRLAADIFQMAAEALSNVHRHTNANAVTLILESGATGTVVLRVENETSDNTKRHEFRPESISDRADALGGKTEVELQDGRTVVRVEIPL